jgi:hypothetical protein
MPVHYFAIHANRDLTDESYALGTEFARIVSVGSVGVHATFSITTDEDIAEAGSVADDVFLLTLVEADDGTYALVYNEVPTDDLDFDATAQEVADALAALVGTDDTLSDRYNVAVWEADDAPLTFGIQFVGNEANQIHTLTVDDALLEFEAGAGTATVFQVMLGGTVGTAV